MKLLFESISSQLIQYGRSRISALLDKGGFCEFYFEDVLLHVEILSKLLTDLGINRQHKIGLKSSNCYEWLVWDLAALQLGLPIIAFAEDSDFDPTGAAGLYGVSLFALSHHVPRKMEDTYLYLPIDIFLIQQEERDKFINARQFAFICSNSDVATESDDLYSQVFSSGTSGHVKGLNISRKGSEYLVNAFNDSFQISERDSTIIFLPLANYQQRLITYSCISTGADFCITNIQGIFFQLLQFKPTFLIAPPVIYEKILIMANSQEKEKQKTKLRLSFGGNTRFLITGMAPIKQGIIQQYLEAGLLLLEAYGVTETGLIAYNTPDDYKVGSVGKPLAVDHIQFSESNELLIKRPHPLSLGYFECKYGEDKDTFLANGSIATGDIGKLDNEEGFLHLSGRKKDIIVTSAGVKLHPSQLEQSLYNPALFEQVAVFYNTVTSQLSAVLVVAKERHSDSLRQAIDAHFEQYNENVASYKKITRLLITHDEFSPNNNTLTKNLKINRSVIQAMYDSKAVTDQS